MGTNFASAYKYFLPIFAEFSNQIIAVNRFMAGFTCIIIS